MGIEILKHSVGVGKTLAQRMLAIPINSQVTNEFTPNQTLKPETTSWKELGRPSTIYWGQLRLVIIVRSIWTRCPGISGPIRPMMRFGSCGAVLPFGMFCKIAVESSIATTSMHTHVGGRTIPDSQVVILEILTLSRENFSE